MKAWQAGLLGGLGALLANVVTCSSAHALLGVGDLVFDPTAVAELIKQVENGIRTLEQLKAQYEAIAHLPDNIMGMARQLTTTPTLQNPLPQANTINRLAGGLGLTDGAAGMVTQNRYYEPQGADWTAQEMNRRATATANLQAMAQQSLVSIEERQASLKEFYAGIEESPDIQQSAAIQARLQLEQNFVAGQQAQAQQMMAMVEMQNRVDVLRAEEKKRKDAQEAIDGVAGGNTGALVN